MKLITCHDQIDKGMTAKINVTIAEIAMRFSVFRHGGYYWSYISRSGFADPVIDCATDFGDVMYGLYPVTELDDWNVYRVPLPTLPYAL